jgi:hypothetical protein
LFFVEALSRRDLVAKQRTNSGRRKPSLAREQAGDPINDELNGIARQREPLEHARLVRCKVLLNCAAVKQHAGMGATKDQLARSLADVIRTAIESMAGDEKLIAEATFGLHEFADMFVYKRLEKLNEKESISINIAKERRANVLGTIRSCLNTCGGRVWGLPGELLR